MKKAGLAVVLLALAACKTLSSAMDDEPNYASDAAANMKRGDEAMSHKNFEEAEKYFEHIRTKYPYLEASREAELKLADSAFEREQYPLARDRYQAFAKLHPTHPKADYAAYRAVQTHAKEVPTEFFFMPPSREKDQTHVLAALRSANDFVRQYPQSSYNADAKKISDDMRRRMALHELYVADFYAKRKYWKAVVARLNGVERDFPGLGYDEKALFGLYDAYSHLNQQGEAKGALQRIIQRFPGSPAARKAQKLLGS